MLRRYRLPGLVLVAALASILAYTSSTPPEQNEGPEVSPAAAGLLRLVNTGSEQALRRAPGLRPEVVARILSRRTSGVRFKNLVELQKATQMNEKDIEDALRPFQEAEDARAAEAQRKPVPEPPAPGKAGGRLQRAQQSSSKGETDATTSPVQTGQGPIGGVRGGFYGKLPGYEDLDKIDPLLKKEFLETVNREMCSCGCSGHTLARCLVNDPGCPVIKARVKKVYDDIVNKPR